MLAFEVTAFRGPSPRAAGLSSVPGAPRAGPGHSSHAGYVHENRENPVRSAFPSGTHVLHALLH